MRKILVTGGAGFIGSALVRRLIRETDYQVLNLDALTYAGNLHSLDPVQGAETYRFEQADVRNRNEIAGIVSAFRPDAIMHLAAESHVDRSIEGPLVFVETNVLGTANLLDVTTHYWRELSEQARADFRFLHVSTDEVYGDLGGGLAPADEATAYMPSSPYSASKAGGDHLVRSWRRTYGLPAMITNCSNNYGPYQFPEKFIPKMILNALHGKAMPVYGDGQQVRDWLYVEDHVSALRCVLERGVPGETYNIAGWHECSNLDVAQAVCAELERQSDIKPTGPERLEDLIRFVPDRAGHDRRYALNSGKIQRELGWAPEESFASGLKKTVQWYLENPDWWRPLPGWSQD